VGDISGSTTLFVGTFRVSGTISGLAGTVGLILNGTENLSGQAEGDFVFVSELLSGDTYEVSIETQPDGQACSVGNGSGTINDADVSVTVTCRAIAVGNDDDEDGGGGGGAVSPALLCLLGLGLLMRSYQSRRKGLYM
jgi:hypothetical protein